MSKRAQNINVATNMLAWEIREVLSRQIPERPPFTPEIRKK